MRGNDYERIRRKAEDEIIDRIDRIKPPQEVPKSWLIYDVLDCDIRDKLLALRAVLPSAVL